MSRRVVALVGGLATVGAALFGISRYVGSEDLPGRTRVEPPNVLVIVTDDQRADTLAVMPKTRSLIVDRGIRFENAVVTTPLCCPSRASIYSGKYAHNHGVWDNDNTSGLLDTTQTVQHVLHESGYFTAHVDRYLNNWREWTQEPPDFDLYAVQLEERAAWRPRHALINGDRVFVRDYTTRWIGQTANDFLDQFEETNDSRPWMLFVTTRAPHLPAIPEPKYEHTDVGPFVPPPSVGEDLSDKPWLQPLASSRADQIEKARRHQLRSLISVDDIVGELLAHLRDLDELRNTLVIFTSDNGGLRGEHGLEAKRWPYDESLRVPMLLRWDAGAAGRGIRRTDVVANIDIAPTIYDAADIEPPYVVDGRSLLSGHRRRELLVEYRHDDDSPHVPRYLGVWTPGWVFLHFPELGHNEFYAEDDPYELDNLYRMGTAPDPKPYLSRLRSWINCSGAACP